MRQARLRSKPLLPAACLHFSGTCDYVTSRELNSCIHSAVVATTASKMVVRLRLARHGTRNNPFFHLVAIQNTKARNARPIEKLGEYDPVPRPVRPPAPPRSSEDRPGYKGQIITSGVHHTVNIEKRIEWNEDRIRYWLNTGAQPSKPVARILDKVCILTN